MNDFPVSRRLSGIPAILIYLALIVGFAPSIIRHHQVAGSASGLILMLMLIVIYALLSSLGWRWIVLRGERHLIQGYFVVITLLAMSMFLLENADTLTGSGAGNLFVVVLLQSGMLPMRQQLLLHSFSILAMTLITAFISPLDQALFMGGIVFMTNGAIALIGRLIVRNEQTQIALEAAHRKLSNYAAQAEELATMRERNRLAREIHDNLGHYLTVVNTQIEAARAVMPADPQKGDDLLQRAQTLTKEGLSEIRRSVAALRSAPVEQRPLPEAIRALIEEHSASGLVITYQIDGQIRLATPPVEMALYRTAQEGLTNIRKHAHATTADLRLCYAAERISLSIHDNGQGGAAGESGFGLLGLQERLKLLGGGFKTESLPNAGFTLYVEVPA